MLDKTLILRKLANLEQYLQQVREFSSVTQDTYETEWKIQRAVERTLQMMIEVCADIAAHIVSEKRLRVPTSYADTFRALFEGGFINAELCQLMEKMAKFRNVLVHNYDEVDAAIVVAILREHLDDFLKFRDAVLAALCL